MKKIMTAIFSFLLLVSLLSSQSLVELAKKEKERRAKLKGKKVTVVTNADLKKHGKGPAVSIIEPAYVEEEIPTGPGTPKRFVSKQASSSTIEKIDQEEVEDPAVLEEKWKRANEQVDLLTLRMNSLQQTFFSFENQYDRAEMQREIAETFLRLQKARQDAEKAKQELDMRRTKKRK